MALLAALATWAVTPVPYSDLEEPWTATQLWRAGQNPYDHLGPGKHYDRRTPLLYPLPALVLLWPLTFVPLKLAEVLFVSFGLGLFAFALTKYRLGNPALWTMLTSLAVVATVGRAQWAPMLIGAAFLSPAGFGLVAAAKPSIGAALFCAYPSRMAIVAGGVFTLVTVVVWPWWVASWRASIGTVPHMAPLVFLPGGFLVLLALLKWRLPEARLLVALACIPHSVGFYEAVSLFLVVRTWPEGIALSLLTYATYGLMPDRGALSTTASLWHLWGLYVPCLLCILRRPNLYAAPVLQTSPALPYAQ